MLIVRPLSALAVALACLLSAGCPLDEASQINVTTTVLNPDPPAAHSQPNHMDWYETDQDTELNRSQTSFETSFEEAWFVKSIFYAPAFSKPEAPMCLIKLTVDDTYNTYLNQLVPCTPGMCRWIAPMRRAEAGCPKEAGHD